MLLENVTAKENKAGAPYAISKYGKEYGTPATRLLFDHHLTRAQVLCRYAYEHIPNKNLTP